MNNYMYQPPQNVFKANVHGQEISIVENNENLQALIKNTRLLRQYEHGQVNGVNRQISSSEEDELIQSEAMLKQLLAQYPELHQQCPDIKF